MPSVYDTLNAACGSAHYRAVKEVKSILGIPWRAPLIKECGGVLTIFKIGEDNPGNRESAELLPSGNVLIAVGSGIQIEIYQ